MSQRSLVLSFALTATTLPFIATAHAQKPSAEARDTRARAADLKRKGDRAMDLRHDDEALAAYTEGIAVFPLPELLYNRGRIYEARGAYPEALADFERFAREAPADVQARVPRLRQLLNDVRAHVTTVTVGSNVPGARVVVRGHVVGNTPLGPLLLASGSAPVEVTAEGYTPYTNTFDLPGGGATSIDATLVSTHPSGILRVTALGPAHVLVDGNAAGDAPAELIVDAGTHSIVAKRDGYEDAHASVVVASGEHKEVAVTPAAKPGVASRWWFWASVGAVVISAAAATYALRTERSADPGVGFQPAQVATQSIRF